MVTPEPDLHTGLPLWKDYTVPRVATRTLSGHAEADVLVIGAGISGAMMADRLADQGLAVAIADKGVPVMGSTLASTALIQYEIDEPLIRLMEMIGKKRAAGAWRRSRLAMESLAARIKALDIECGFERRDSLLLNGSILDTQGLERELMERRAIGIDGEMIYRKTLREDYGISGGAAILSRNNIACNPVQLARGFLKAAVERGAILYAPADMERLVHNKHSVRAFNAQGDSITARYVIFATGYAIPKYIKTRKHRIVSTWAIATAPVKGMPPRLPMMWEASDPYCYGRTTMDGCMLFGGEDEEFSDDEKRDALIPRKTKTLERKLRKRFPDWTFEINHAWAGSFGASTNGLPSIGKIPGMKNCYAVMAYGGNGITFSRVAAELIAADIFGYRDFDKELFAFTGRV